MFKAKEFCVKEGARLAEPRDEIKDNYMKEIMSPSCMH